MLCIQRVDAKHFRWHAEIVSGGCLLLYQAGKGSAHRGPDCLSRNPPERDLLNLSRTGDWHKWRALIRGIDQNIADQTFDDEDPPLHQVVPEMEIPEGVDHIPEQDQVLCPECQVDLGVGKCQECSNTY